MKSILIYAIADRQSGCGHVKRQLVLANELLSRGHRVAFETTENTPGYNLVCKWAADTDNLYNINHHGLRHDIAILDLEGGPTRPLLETCRRKFPRTVVVGGVGFPMVDQDAIDDLVDLQIYQSVAVNEGWSQHKALVGCEYLIIDPVYLQAREAYSGGSDALVVMGGADPHGITRSVAEKVLACRNGHGYGVSVVLGPAAPLTYVPDGVGVYNSPENLAECLLNSRFVVSALGMTTYEAMCVGVPTASICWSRDHELTAIELERLGATVNLGTWDNIDWNRMERWVDWITDLSGDALRWRKTSSQGQNLVDGLGVKRVADAIEELA